MKCRGTKTGCSQCQNPAFTGQRCSREQWLSLAKLQGLKWRLEPMWGVMFLKQKHLGVLAARVAVEHLLQGDKLPLQEKKCTAFAGSFGTSFASYGLPSYHKLWLCLLWNCRSMLPAAAISKLKNSRAMEGTGQGGSEPTGWFQKWYSRSGQLSYWFVYKDPANGGCCNFLFHSMYHQQLGTTNVISTQKHHLLESQYIICFPNTPSYCTIQPGDSHFLLQAGKNGALWHALSWELLATWSWQSCKSRPKWRGSRRRSTLVSIEWWQLRSTQTLLAEKECTRQQPLQASRKQQPLQASIQPIAGFVWAYEGLHSGCASYS